MALVWDSTILCDKAVYAFNRYALSQFRLYLTFSGTRFSFFWWKQVGNHVAEH